ncbi:flagellar basal-body MS-ring/collar protein FliF [Paracoccus sp. MC1862]|uniref:flagellar basal-body MS-ring/collar protein FliF n=1 Tax=Paracoccus sp. MC1862 TaxID=2760307 RepID=UPI001602D1D3|nr:flagellar basal-body MS-ring/collar protein FliF [Paracoccus sp. MC1862]MBB1498768.1 flagellar M-ring protein FliF [Paracoccus sp. MC1862]QQO43928.1 flagellar M-ring protein FliF [Paracoccus sp. MC1862]
MQKLAEYWGERSSSQKQLIAAAFLLTFLAVGAFALLANRTPMALLYSGLDPARAGEVMAELDKTGVPSEIRGDAIWVDAGERDRVRLVLAGMGLPSAGGAGYEILDGMSGFGTTSQMFDAAYWRAKEGELARTILTVPGVKAARVHIAAPATRGYRRDAGGAASVTVTMGVGSLDAKQARSLQFLLSSAVPGLDPERVKVIDSARGIVSTGEETVAADRAAEMKRNVERILEPHVGPGNAIVELNLDLVTETEQLSEQTFDPNGRALVSQENEETTDQSTNSEQGAVTASSNLPEGTGAQGEQSRSTSSETRQRQNYEVSRVTREILREPGATRRLTVAVLVNGTPQRVADGSEAILPRSEVELEALRELVASAVGFDEERGDVITVKSLPFSVMGTDGTLAEPGGIISRLALNDLARLALIGFFALAVAMVVMRPILRSRAVQAQLDNSGAASGEILPPASAALAAEAVPALVPVSADLDVMPPAALADPVARLRELMRERREESVRILSGWIAQKEET